MTENLQQTSQELSALQKVVKIFTDPAALFESVRQRPSWLLPLILIIAGAIAFSVATKDQMLAQQKQVIYDSEKIPEEYKDQAIEQIDSMSPKKYYIRSVIGSMISVPLIYAIVGGVFLLVGNFFLGGKATFKQTFAVVVWGNMVGLVEMLVKGFLAIQKGSMQVYTSLAILLDPAQNKTFLFALANAIDLFSIWKIILWSMGFAIIYRFSSKKAYTTVIALYVVYTLAAFGFGRLFV